MARIRTIKPDFFRHEGLFEAERSSGLPLRIAFAGLWTAADREGRFRWQPRALKLDCLPYDDMDFGAVLDALAEHGFIVRYEIDGQTFGYVPAWNKHQHVNIREAQSSIPAPAGASTIESTCAHIPARVEGKGKEQEGKGKELSSLRSDTAPEKKSRRKPKIAWPEGLSLTDDRKAVGRKRGLKDSEIPSQWAQFKNHAATNDRRCANWEAAWDSWCIKALEFKGRELESEDGVIRLPSAAVPKHGDKLPDGQVFLKADTPEYDAWCSNYRARELPNPPRHFHGGWRFPTQWPSEIASRETESDGLDIPECLRRVK